MNLQALISQGEHQQQDFKYAITSISKIAHSLSAFANTDGGRLLVGVRDNGKIAGVKSEEEIYMIDAAAQQCIPPVDCNMQVVREEGHQVLIVSIPPCNDRPVCAREDDGQYRAYIRQADENIVASPIHLEMWQQLYRRNNLTFTNSDNLLLQLFPPEGLTLNQFTRHSRLTRLKAIRLLAGWTRLGLLQLRYQEPRWLLVPC